MLKVRFSTTFLLRIIFEILNYWSADLLNTDKPDERQIMTYVSCYYHAFQGAMQVNNGFAKIMMCFENCYCPYSLCSTNIFDTQCWKIIWQAIFLRQQKKTIQNMLNLTRIWFTMFKIMQKVSICRKNYNFSKFYFSREIVIFVWIYTRKMTTFKKWDIFGNFYTLCILIYYPILKLEFRRSLHHAIRHKLKMTNPPFLQKL